MAALYLTDPGAVLHKSSDLFIVHKRHETLLEVPCAEVEHVMLYGNIQVTTAALRKLAEHGIPLVHFNQNVFAESNFEKTANAGVYLNREGN